MELAAAGEGGLGQTPELRLGPTTGLAAFGRLADPILVVVITGENGIPMHAGMRPREVAG
jgi:uncharacterized protein YwlG (UPF0340 family)